VGSAQGGRDRVEPRWPRYVGFVMAVLASWVCALFADWAFLDIAIRRGVFGFVFWVPSVILGIAGVMVGLRHLSARTRWVVGAFILALPLWTLVRWFIVLAT
jgi:hypothetical protein